jgi:hypothetical protein
MKSWLVSIVSGFTRGNACDCGFQFLNGDLMFKRIYLIRTDLDENSVTCV